MNNSISTEKTRARYMIVMSFVVICTGFLLSSCDKDDDAEHQDVIIIDNNKDKQKDDNGGETVDVARIIKENVSVSVKYEYYTFSLELTTHLAEPGQYFAGRTDIKYGVEWYYNNRLGGETYSVYSQTFDTGNSFFRETKVSSNHYSVIIPVFTWEDNDNKTVTMNMYAFKYRTLKQKEENGEIKQDEKTLITRLEGYLSPYISEVNAYRGKVYAEIGGKKYYIKLFQK